MWRGFAELLGDPGVRRMPRDAEVQHAARAQLDNEEDVGGSEEKIDHREKVAGPDVLGVVL